MENILECPNAIEELVQETGQGGRDGCTVEAILN